MNREFNFKASTLNFWHLLIFSLISMAIGLILSHFILPSMNFTRLILAGCITLILMQLILFSKKYILKVKLIDGKLVVYKNAVKIIDVPITDIEKLQARNINDSHPIGDLKIFIKNQKSFYFSLLIVSDSKTKTEQEQNLRTLLRSFIEQYHFKKEDHYSKLGKSKFLFEYINQKKGQ
ncbi:hypothetical protein [Chryseobacterium sp. MYb328]|uniref:hypothetical protein n=1 Tax=Chryseobacterium sp. MYb328 TaxID=2745231 RepID=UPI0030B224EA